MSTVDIRVLTSIGNCHRKLKSFDDGITFFDAALKREPDNFYALFGMGDCYRGLNQPHHSLEYWNKILCQDQANKVILTRSGDAYVAMKEFDKATEYYSRALAIEFDTYAVLGLAIIAKLHGKLDEAITSLAMLMETDSKNHRPYIEIAECYLKKGNKDAAIEALRNFKRTGIRNNMINDLLDRLLCAKDNENVS
jgi:tetratricopeptide (TPR) repeat protein